MGDILDDRLYKSMLLRAVKTLAIGATEADDNRIEIEFVYDDKKMRITCQEIGAETKETMQ